MNSDGFTYIFYDKHHKDSTYKNPITVEYTLEKVFALDCEIITNQDAIDEFNSYTTKQHQIKDKLNYDFYKVFLFKYEDKKFMILGVDNKKLEESIDNIPNKEFLLNACSCHISYEKYSKQSKEVKDNKLKIPNKSNSMLQLEEFFKNTIITNTDQTDPIIDNPQFTKIVPFDYQRKTVCWMLKRELENKNIYYSFNDEIYFGNVVCDLIKKDIIKADSRRSILFRGGLLAEEVGLGKTFETIMTSLLNPAVNCSYFNDKEKRLQSRATIILGPNHLCNQWIREFDKTVKDDFKLKVIPMFTKNHHDKYSYYDLLDADFIIVSFNFLKNEACYTNWLKITSTKTKKALTFIASDDFNVDNIQEQMSTLYDEFKLNPKKLSDKQPILPLIYFNRIAFDEFHEVPLNYLTIYKMLPLFKGKYKWAITGTPFNNSDLKCLQSMISYLTNNESSTDVEKLFEIKTLNNYFNTKFYRRNTKQSVINEYKLEPYDEKVLLLKMSPTERAIYNAYLANPNINRFSELVRQLCDDPRIADEIKGELSDCKTPEDIEKTLVKHYQKDVELMQNKIDFTNYRIKKTERRITIIEYKRQRKYLKQKGFRVKIEYPQKIYDPKFENRKGLVNVNEYNDEDEKSESESEDEDEDDVNGGVKKELITVNVTNQSRITKLVGLELSKNPSITLQKQEELKKDYEIKLEEFKKLYDGKKTTCNFFTNMMEKIKKLKEKQERKNDNEDDDDEDDDADNCTICLGDITGDDVGVLKCGHLYCFQCIKEYVVKNPRCPICRKDVKASDLSMISFEKPKVADTKELKDKQDLIAKVGTKLANLILYIKSLNEKCIIFSQWDEMLKNVGDTLDTYNIRNVFCRGNVWTRDKAIRSFTSDPNIKAIMLSSGSAAAGTNLTAASTVILLDPVYKESQDGTMGSYEYRRNVEWQAIGRAYRTGQTKKVTVVRMIIKDSVEEEIYKKNKEEDGKYKDNKALIDKLLEVNDDSINIGDDDMKKLNKDGAEKAKLKEAKKPTKKPVKKIEVESDDDSDSDLDED
jgi:SNF2 family DNA or RNA helicase